MLGSLSRRSGARTGQIRNIICPRLFQIERWKANTPAVSRELKESLALGNFEIKYIDVIRERKKEEMCFIFKLI